VQLERAFVLLTEVTLRDGLAAGYKKINEGAREAPDRHPVSPGGLATAEESLARDSRMAEALGRLEALIAEAILMSSAETSRGDMSVLRVIKEPVGGSTMGA
jgi:hypothetical protein